MHRRPTLSFILIKLFCLCPALCRWTPTHCVLKTLGRQALRSAWHQMPSWRVESCMLFAPSTRMTTVRRVGILSCTPMTHGEKSLSLWASLFPTHTNTSPLSATTLETISSTYGTTTTSYATLWISDPHNQLQVKFYWDFWCFDNIVLHCTMGKKTIRNSNDMVSFKNGTKYS